MHSLESCRVSSYELASDEWSCRFDLVCRDTLFSPYKLASDEWSCRFDLVCRDTCFLSVTAIVLVLFPYLCLVVLTDCQLF